MSEIFLIFQLIEISHFLPVTTVWKPWWESTTKTSTASSLRWVWIVFFHLVFTLVPAGAADDWFRYSLRMFFFDYRFLSKFIVYQGPLDRVKREYLDLRNIARFDWWIQGFLANLTDSKPIFKIFISQNAGSQILLPWHRFIGAELDTFSIRTYNPPILLRLGGGAG